MEYFLNQIATNIFSYQKYLSRRSEANEDPHLYSHCPAGTVVIMLRSPCIYLSKQPLIGPKWECYLVEEVIQVDELNKVKISAAPEAEFYKLALTMTLNNV